MELSAADARRLFLRAQRVYGSPDRRAGVRGLLRALAAVQLDTISVLARSHELVAYARLGAVGRAKVEDAYWGRDAGAFEYWAHAACIMPLEYWPFFAYRRRRSLARYNGHYAAPRKEVLARLRAEGPLTATELGGAKKGGPWWDWSDTKEAIEIMLAEGQVVCLERRGWKRVYDLAERAVPDGLLNHAPTEEEAFGHLVQAAGRRLGVATHADLADYFRLKRVDVTTGLERAGLVPVTVRGWKDPAWADPGLLNELETGALRGGHRTTLLSPFDSLVWDRARTARVFGFTHRLEAYVPKPKRIHGYFAMPLLTGGKLVGRVDPGRAGNTLVAKQATVGTRHVPALARALAEAASWVGADSVAVERLDPPRSRRSLVALLAEGGL
ncbi:MAG: winged helix-turn-helix domain-containing protein [Actinomycetota bacterium]